MPDRTQVEGTRGGDKGREVNPGKQYKETEMVWRIDRGHNGEEIETKN